MTLAADPPRPPDLTTTVPPVDETTRPESEHREEIETMFANGAWARAFGEWTEHTDLTAEDWAIVLDLGLVDEFDFWWNADDGRIEYDPPTIPDDWEDDDRYAALDSFAQVSAIDDALDGLGQVVQDLLEQEYADWNTEEPSDQPE